MVIYLLSFDIEFDIEFKRSVIGSVFSVDTTKEQYVNNGSGGVSDFLKCHLIGIRVLT